MESLMGNATVTPMDSYGTEVEKSEQCGDVSLSFAVHF